MFDEIKKIWKKYINLNENKEIFKNEFLVKHFNFNDNAKKLWKKLIK